MTLPGYEAQRVENMWWAFSNKKQNDYDTKVLDADMTMMHPIKESSVGVLSKEIRSDRATFGKGHEFATASWEVARDVRFSRAMDGSSTILGWAFAFAMGKVVTTQPDPTGSPNTYHHKITLFDPVSESTAMLPTTSIVESVSAGIKRLLYSMAVTSLTISAEGFEQLQVALEMIGSGETEVSTLGKPSMPALSYLTSNYATVKLGDAIEDISTRVRSWSVVLNNNPKEARGYFPTSGMYRGRLEIGSRTILPTLVVDVAANSDLLDDFLAETELALDIYCEGAYTEGTTYRHYLRIRFPKLKYRALPLGENDGVFTYAVTFDEETVLYDAASSPAPLVQVDVRNKISSYLEASV